MDNTRDRFKTIEWFNMANGLDISIIGLGGIGSWLSIPLGRLGENDIYLFDKDAFEKHNMSGQLVSSKEIGKNKVDIAVTKIQEYSTNNAVYANDFFDEDSIVTPIIFCGVDSIPVRKMIFERWLKEYGENDKFEAVFIDGRLTSESFQVFTVLPGTKELKEYQEKELNEEGLQELPCTLKQTTHVAQTLAGFMISIFTNWLTKCEVRTLPYYLREDIQLFVPERRFYGI